MTVKASYSTPLLRVVDVERSLRFYARLGFETVDVDGAAGSAGWARAHCEGGAIMFLREEEEEDGNDRADSQGGRQQDRFLLYLYTPDLPALRAQLVAAGVDVGPIVRPGYMPSGEVRVTDPDGYVILIGHWGQQEHEAWERQRERKREAGLIP